MLEFYYDFLDRYFDRRDFELIQMDTDSNYMAISAEKLEDIVKPELQTEFEAKKKEWLSWDKWSSRTPGLFKLECEGSRMIALCSKCYYIDESEGKKRSSARKGCRRNKTRSRGSISRKLWKAARTLQLIEVLGCGTGRWLLTNSRSWG